MAASVATIFISYRRADSASETGRIYDRLVERYGRAQIFKDVDSIPPGVNFPDYIEESIQASDVALVVIGSRWLDASAGWGRRRLDDPADFVRIEIETALRLGVPVIPVLVGGASLPLARRLSESLRPLLEQNGLVVRQDPDFTRDMERVYHAVNYWIAQPRRAPAPPPVSAAMPEPTLMPMTTSPAAEREPESEFIPTSAPATSAPATTVAAQRGADVRQKRLPRALSLTLVSALLVIAVGVGALKAGALSAFTAPSAPTASPATRTIAAYRATYAVTATARAILGKQVYAPASFGPCDKTPAYIYDHDTNTYYWQVSSAALVVCAADHKTTVLGGGSDGSGLAQVTFYGLPYYDTGWPANYTVAMYVGFANANSSTYQYDCMSMDAGIRYTVNPPPTEAYAKPISVNVCRDGEWSTSSLISQSAAHQGSFGSGPLHFTLTVHGRDYSVSVNGRELIRTTQVDSGYVDSVRFTNASSGATPNAITLSNFVLTPTAS